MLSGFGSFEGLANLIQNLFAIRKMMKGPLLDIRRGIIKDFRIQPKIRIGDLYEVSVVYEGSIKTGYFSLMIQDADESNNGLQIITVLAVKSSILEKVSKLEH